MADTAWYDSSKSSYTCESADVNGLLVTVCLDDEGPITPAHYWLVEDHGSMLTDGWASTVDGARDGARDAARACAADKEARRV